MSNIGRGGVDPTGANKKVYERLKKKKRKEALTSPMVKLAKAHGDGGFVTAPENQPEISKFVAPPTNIGAPTTRDTLAKSIIAADAAWRDKTGMSISPEMMMTILQTQQKLPSTKEEWLDMFGTGLNGPLMDVVRKNSFVGSDGNPVKTSGKMTTMYDMYGIDITDGMLGNNMGKIYGWTEQGAADWMDEKDIPQLPTPGAIRGILKKLDNKVRFDLEELSPNEQSAYALMNYGIVQWKRQWKQVLIDRGVPAEKLQWDASSPEWNAYFDAEYHKYLLGRVIPYTQQTEDLEKQERAQNLLQEILPEAIIADPKKDPEDFTKNITYITQVYLADMFKTVGGPQYGDEYAKELMFRGWVDGRVPGQTATKARWDYAHEFGFNLMPSQAVEKCLDEASTLEGAINKIFGFMGEGFEAAWEHTPWELVFNNLKDRPGALGDVMGALDTMSGHVYKTLPIPGVYLGEAIMKAEHGLVTAEDFLHDLVQNEGGLTGFADADAWAQSWRDTEGKRFIQHAVTLIAEDWDLDEDNKYLRPIVYGSDLALELYLFGKGQKFMFKGGRVGVNQTFKLVDSRINLAMRAQRGGTLSPLAMKFWFRTNKEAASLAAERAMASHQRGAAFFEEELQAARVARGEKPFEADDPLTGVPKAGKKGKPKEKKPKEDIDNVSIKGKAEERANSHPIDAREKSTNDLLDIAAAKKSESAPKVEEPIAPEPKAEEPVAPEPKVEEPGVAEPAVEEAGFDAAALDESIAAIGKESGILGELKQPAMPLDQMLTDMPIPKSKAPTFPRSKDVYAPSDLGNGYKLAILQENMPDGTPYFIVNILDKSGDYVADAVQDGFKTYPEAVRAAKESVKDGTVDDILADKGVYHPPEQKYVIDSDVNDIDIVEDAKTSLKAAEEERSSVGEAGRTQMDELVEQGDKMAADEAAAQQEVLYQRAFDALQESKAFDDLPDIDTVATKLYRSDDPFEIIENEKIVAARESVSEWANRDAAVESVILKMEDIAASVKDGFSPIDRQVSLGRILGQAKKIADEYGFDFYPIFHRWKRAFRDGFVTGELGEIIPYTAEHFRREVNKLVEDMADIKHFGLNPWLPDDVISMFTRSGNPELTQAMFLLQRESVTRELNELGVWNEVRRSTGSHPKRPKSAYKEYTPSELNAIFDSWVEEGVLSPEHPLVYRRKQRGGNRNEEQQYVIDVLQQRRDQQLLAKFGIRLIRDAHMNELQALHRIYDEGKPNSLAAKVKKAADEGNWELMNKLREDIFWELKAVKELSYTDRIRMLKSGMSPAKRVEFIRDRLQYFGKPRRGQSAQDRVPDYSAPQVPIDDFVLAKPWRSKDAVTVTDKFVIEETKRRIKDLQSQRSAYIVQRTALEEAFAKSEKIAEGEIKRGADAFDALMLGKGVNRMPDEQYARATSLTEKIDEIDQRIRIVKEMLDTSRSSYNFVGKMMPLKWQRQKAIQIARDEGFLEIGTGIEYKYGVRLEWSAKGVTHVVHRYGEITDYIIDGEGHIIGYEITPMRGYRLHDYIDGEYNPEAPMTNMKKKLIETNYLPGSTQPAPFKLVNYPTDTTGGLAKGYARPDKGGHGTLFKVVRDKELVKDMSFDEPVRIGKRKERGEWEASVAKKTGGINADEYAIVYESDTFAPDRPSPHGKKMALGNPGEELATKGKVRFQWRIVADDVTRINPHTVTTKAGEQRYTFHHPDLGADAAEGVAEAVIIETLGRKSFEKVVKMSPDRIAMEAFKISTDPASIRGFVPQTWAEAVQLYATEILLKNGHDAGILDTGVPGVGNEILVANQTILKTGLQYTRRKTSSLKWNAKLRRYEVANLDWTDASWPKWRDEYVKRPGTRSGVKSKGRKVRPSFHEITAETSIADVSTGIVEKTIEAADNMTAAQRMSRLKAVDRRLNELRDGKGQWKPVDEFDYKALELEKTVLIERVAQDGYDPALFDFTKSDLNAKEARRQFEYNKMTPKQRERHARTQELLDIAAGKKTKKELLEESAARAEERAKSEVEEPEYAEGVEELPAVGEEGFGAIDEFDPYGEYPIPPGDSAGGYGINATPDILSRSEASANFHTLYRAATRAEADVRMGQVEGRVGATVREKTEMGELLGKLAGLTEAGKGKIRPLFRNEFNRSTNLGQFRSYEAYISDFILKADLLVRRGARKVDDFIVPIKARRTAAKATGRPNIIPDTIASRGRYAGRNPVENFVREDVGTSPLEVTTGEKLTGPKTTKGFIKKTKQQTSLIEKEDIEAATRAGIEISPEELDFSPEHLQAVKAMAEAHGIKYEVEGSMSVTIDNAHYEVPEIFRLTGEAEGMKALLKDMYEWAPDPEVPPLRSLPAMFRSKAEMIAYNTSKNSNHGNFIRHLLGLPDTEICPEVKPYIVRLEAAKHASGKAERGKYAPEGVLDILADMEKDPVFEQLFLKEGGPGVIDPSSPGIFSAARHRMYEKAFDSIGHIPIAGNLAQETMRIMGTPIALEKELPLYDKPDFIRNTSWSVKMGRKTMDKKARQQALRHEEAMLMAGSDKAKIRAAVRAWEADIKENLKERGLLDKWEEYSKKINRNRAQMYVKINKDMIRAYEEEIGVRGERVAADTTIPADWRQAVKRQKRDLKAAVAEARLRGDTLLAKQLEGQLEKAVAEMKRTSRDMEKYIRALDSGKKPKNFGALEQRMQKFLHSEPVYSFQFADTYPIEMNMRYLAWFQSGKTAQWFTKYIDTPTLGAERWMRVFKMMIMGTIAFPIRVMAGDELWRPMMEGIIPGTKRYKAARERAMYLRGGVDPQSYFMGRVGQKLGLGLDKTILTRKQRARFHELESKIDTIENEIAGHIKHKESLEKAHPEWLDNEGKLTKVKGSDAADYRGTQRMIDELEDQQVEYYDMVRVTTPQGTKTAQSVMAEKTEMDLAEALDTSNFMIVHPNDGHPEFAAAFSDWFGKFSSEPLVKVWKNNGRPKVEGDIRTLFEETLRGDTPEGQALREALYNSHRIKGSSATVEGMNALLDKMQKKGTTAERYNVENILRIWTNSIFRVTKSEMLTDALIRGNITSRQVTGMLKNNRGGELWAIPMTSAWRYGGNRVGYKLNLPARYYQHATLPLLGYLSRKTREILFADRVNQYLKDVEFKGGQGELYVKMAEDRAAGWVNRSTFTRSATVFEDLTRDIIPFLNSYRQFWIYWTKMMFTKPLTMAVLSQVPQDLYDMGLSEGQQIGPFTLYLQSLIPFFLQTAPGEEPTEGVFGSDGKKGLVSPDGLYALPNIEPVMATLLGSLFTAATDGETLENFPLFESSSRSLAPLSRYGMLLESFGIDVGRLMRDSDKLHANWYNVKRQYLNTGRVERDEKGQLPLPLSILENIPGMHNEDAFLKFWIGTFSPVSAGFTPEMPKQLTAEQAQYFKIHKENGEDAARRYLNNTKYWQYLYEYRFTTNMKRKIELAEEFPWLPNFNSSNYNWESPYGEVFDMSKGREIKEWEEVLKETMDERLGVYGGWGKNIHGEPFPYPGDAVKSELYGPIAKKHMKEIQDYAENAALVYAQGNKKLAGELMTHWKQLTPGMVDFLNHGTIPTWRKGALMPEWYERALREDGKDLEYWHPGKYMASLVEAAGRKGDYYAAGYTIPPSEAKMEIYQKLVGSGYIPGDIQERIKAGPWGKNIEKWQKEQELDWVRHQADLETDQYFQIDVNQLEQLTGKKFGPKLEDALRDVRLYYYTYFTGNEEWQKKNPVGSDGYKRGRQAFYKYKDERMKGVPGGELFIGGAPERLLMNPYLTRVKTQFVGPDAEKDQKLWNAYLKEARKDKPDMRLIEALKRRFDEHLMDKWDDRQRVNDWVYVIYNAKNLRRIMMESYSDYYEGPGNSVYSKMGLAMVARLEKIIKEQAKNSTLFKSNLKSLFDNNPHQLAWHLLDWYNY